MSDGDLRVLMVEPSARLGGQEAVLLNLATGLPSHGIQPTVISLRDGPLLPRLAEAGIGSRVIPHGRIRYARQFARTVRRLDQIISDLKPAVVYSNMPLAHLYASLPAARQRIAAIWCQANFPEPPHAIDLVASWMPAAAVLCVSRDAAEAQKKLNGRLAVQLMHPGIDVSRFTATDRVSARDTVAAGSGPVVSLIGRLQPWKGQREFLRAAAIVLQKFPEARFAIVGGALLGWEGNYPTELRDLACALGIVDRVIFTGHVDNPEIWSAASDVVVNASSPEPFGLVVVEAMASGAAVVAVGRGGPRDIIQDGITGALCGSAEPIELATRILWLLEDQTRLAKIAAAGKAHALAAFSREQMVGRFAEIVHGAAKREFAT